MHGNPRMANQAQETESPGDVKDDERQGEDAKEEDGDESSNAEMGNEEDDTYPWLSDDPEQFFGGPTPAEEGHMQVDTGVTKRTAPGDGEGANEQDSQQVKANKRATKSFMARGHALEKPAQAFGVRRFAFLRLFFRFWGASMSY